MPQERWITPGKTINKAKLYAELLAALIPAIGVGGDVIGHPGDLRIDYADAATSQQMNADTDAVITAHDGSTPTTRFSALSTGAKPPILIDPAGSWFLPFRLRIGVIQGDTITTPPTLSVGTNSPNYNNILPATLMTGLNAQGRIRNFLIDPSQAINTLTAVRANVTGAATATTCILQVDIIGDSL